MGTERAPVPADVLPDLWRNWAERIARIEPEQWDLPTRCEGWTVRALVAHVAPDPDVLAWLPSAVLDHGAAVSDAADLLRDFNRPGGAAHTMAPAVAAMANASASASTTEALLRRFTASIDVVTEAAMDPGDVVPHPVVGSVTVSVLVELSIMEGTIHLLDLIDAVGGPPPPAVATERTADLLLRVVGPSRFLEVAAGRLDPGDVLPIMR